jgi:hypothetical protein
MTPKGAKPLQCFASQTLSEPRAYTSINCWREEVLNGQRREAT